MAAAPTHDLTEVQRLIREGAYWVTDSAFYDAMALGFDSADIVACVLQLDIGDFYKTMASEKRPGFMQDVYRPTYLTKALYVKVQIAAARQAVVISFKKDESR